MYNNCTVHFEAILLCGLFSKLLIKIILFVHLVSMGNFFSNGLHVHVFAKKAQKIVFNNVSINLHSLGT